MVQAWQLSVVSYCQQALMHVSDTYLTN